MDLRVLSGSLPAQLQVFGQERAVVMQNMLTFMRAKCRLYDAFPFQKNKVNVGDIPAIRAAQENTAFAANAD
jgi:hypothetical protein